MLLLFIPSLSIKYNVRHPLKDLSSVEFVFGVEPVIDVTALFDITASTFQVV